MQTESNFWAIQPQRFQTMALAIRQGRKPVSHTTFAATHGRRSGRMVGVLRLHGVLTQRGSRQFGGTSTEAFGREFDAMLRNPVIGQIVLEIDSPGGEVRGVPELADKIFKARGEKPITSIVNSLAASAAFGVASAANRVVATPSADVGSVGVFALHTDASRALEKEGLKLSFISAGRHKVEGNFAEPLTPTARRHIQNRVDGFHAEFVAALARNRGVSVAKVRSDFGQGRVLRAKDARASGMIDSVAPFDRVLANLGISPAGVHANVVSNDPRELRRRLDQMSNLTGLLQNQVIAS